MLIHITDDSGAHRSILENTIHTIFRQKGSEDLEIVACIHGADLLRKSEEKRSDLVFLDIHMPVLDGLSTLVRYRTKDKATPIVMATLETSESVDRFTKTRDLTGLTEERKMDLLEKVIERVQRGVTEEGKINSVLEAVSSLRLDPIKIAKAYGANEYVNKPYKRADIERVLTKIPGF